MSALAISVVIPTYNRAPLVCRAVGNALAQLTTDDEVIIVDDGSTDNTVDALAAFRGRIRIVHGEHRGAGAARNLGVCHATRPLVAFLDSDDEWMPDKVALQRTLMERRPEVLFSFSDFAGRNDSLIEPHYLVRWHQDPRSWNDILGRGVPYSAIAPLPFGRDDFQVHFGDIYLGEMLSDYVATSTAMVRREAAGAALWFAEDLGISEDKECFARLARAGTAAYLDCDTSYQWEHFGPRITDANSYQYACARLTLLERIWGKDEAFLAQHRPEFAAKCSEQHLKRARWLIAHGRTREAKEDLRRAGKSPLSYRILAALPGPVTRGLLCVRRLVFGGPT